MLIAKVYLLRYLKLMGIIAPIALCFIPFVATFILFALLVKGVKVRQELLASLIGLLCVVPIAFVQFILDKPAFNTGSWLSYLLRSFVMNGIIEEGVKCVFLFALPSKKSTLKPFFCYALLAGMILGSFESVIYFMKDIQKAQLSSAELSLALIYLRMVTAVVIHTLCAGILGLFVYSFKKSKLHLAPVVYVILIHALYDFFTIFNAPIIYFTIAVIILACLESRIWYLRIEAEVLDYEASMQGIDNAVKQIVEYETQLKKEEIKEPKAKKVTVKKTQKVISKPETKTKKTTSAKAPSAKAPTTKKTEKKVATKKVSKAKTTIAKAPVKKATTPKATTSKKTTSAKTTVAKKVKTKK